MKRKVFVNSLDSIGIQNSTEKENIFFAAYAVGIGCNVKFNKTSPFCEEYKTSPFYEEYNFEIFANNLLIYTFTINKCCEFTHFCSNDKYLEYYLKDVRDLLRYNQKLYMEIKHWFNEVCGKKIMENVLQ